MAAQNLYAWKVGNEIVYTLSDTPSVNDKIHKADGTEYAQNEFIYDGWAFIPVITETDSSTYIKIRGTEPA